MADIVFSPEYRLAIDRLYRAFQRELQPTGSLLYIMPVQGFAPDGRLSLLGVDERFLSLLRQAGIPFDLSCTVTA
jgi:hypothetical protein